MGSIPYPIKKIKCYVNKYILSAATPHNNIQRPGQEYNNQRAKPMIVSEANLSRLKYWDRMIRTKVVTRRITVSRKLRKRGLRNFQEVDAILAIMPQCLKPRPPNLQRRARCKSPTSSCKFTTRNSPISFVAWNYLNVRKLWGIHSTEKITKEEGYSPQLDIDLVLEAQRETQGGWWHCWSSPEFNIYTPQTSQVFGRLSIRGW